MRNLSLCAPPTLQRLLVRTVYVGAVTLVATVLPFFSDIVGLVSPLCSSAGNILGAWQLVVPHKRLSRWLCWARAGGRTHLLPALHLFPIQDVHSGKRACRLLLTSAF